MAALTFGDGEESESTMPLISPEEPSPMAEELSRRLSAWESAIKDSYMSNQRETACQAVEKLSSLESLLSELDACQSSAERKAAMVDVLRHCDALDQLLSLPQQPRDGGTLLPLSPSSSSVPRIHEALEDGWEMKEEDEQEMNPSISIRVLIESDFSGPVSIQLYDKRKDSLASHLIQISSLTATTSAEFSTDGRAIEHLWIIARVSGDREIASSSSSLSQASSQIIRKSPKTSKETKKTGKVLYPQTVAVGALPVLDALRDGGTEMTLCKLLAKSGSPISIIRELAAGKASISQSPDYGFRIQAYRSFTSDSSAIPRGLQLIPSIDGLSPPGYC